MAEPMDDSSSSTAGERVYTPGSDAEEELPEGLRDEDDRRHDLLEDVVMAFHVGLEKLPAEARRLYVNFDHDNDFGLLDRKVKELIRDRVLDEFLKDDYFRQTAIALYGHEYPYLKEPFLGDMGVLLRSLDDMGVSLQSLEEGNAETGKGRGPPPHLPYFPPFAGSFKPRPKPIPQSESEEPGAEEGIEGVAMRARTRTESTTIRQLPRRRRISSRTEATRPGDTAQLPTIRFTPRDLAIHEAEISEILDSAASAGIPRDQDETGQEGEDIEMQEQSEAEEDHDSDVEILGDLPVPPEEPVDESARRTARDEYNENWLRDYMANSGFATTSDLELHPYKGWKIAAPKIQLIRAKNFLADEDADRTVDWQRKFAELAEYFSYLLHNYNGEDWGYDLREAIDMLHTHWVFESYHYGKPELTLDFPNVWPDHSQRLPPPPGPRMFLERSGRIKKGERKVVHNKPESAHDDQYLIPKDILKEQYLRQFRDDAVEFRFPGRGRHKTGNRGFNMFKEENAIYDACMQGGLEDTANFLLGEGNLDFKEQDDLYEERGGRTVIAKPESLQAFVKFRGARRAALQQCLNLLDNSENRTVDSQYNGLILPTPRLPDPPDAGIVLDTIPISNVPDKSARDPLKYTFAHKWFIGWDRHWASWTREHAVKEAYGHRIWEGRKEPIMNVPLNYKGPFVIDCLDKEMKKTQNKVKRLLILHQKLKRIAKRVPRNLITDMLKQVDKGLSGKGELDIFSWSDWEMGSIRRPIDIRPDEEEWLHFLDGPSIRQTAAPIELPKQKLSRVFMIRLQAMLDDISPETLFSDTEPKDFMAFVEELNQGGSEKTTIHRFTTEEAMMEARACAEKGMIHIGQEDGRYTISRPSFSFHPENRIRMPVTFGYSMSRMREERAAEERLVRLLQREEEPKEASETSTISTAVSIPKSEEDGDDCLRYRVLPRFDDLFTWDDCIEGRIPEDQEDKVTQFYLRLACRLGSTLRKAQLKHKLDKAKLTPKQRKLNRNFQYFVNKTWHGDAQSRPNNWRKNPEKEPGDWTRVTPQYRDLVKMTEPENYKYGDFLVSEDDSSEARETVRKAIAREAYENNSLLFPSRMISFVDENGQTKEHGIREPVWSFGDPRIRPKAKRFFDIDRWPVEFQDEVTRLKIAGSGPKRQPVRVIRTRDDDYDVRSDDDDDDDDDDGHDGDLTEVAPEHQVQEFRPKSPSIRPRSRAASEAAPEPRERIITYAEGNLDRRVFRPGPVEFWGGDTPLQRQAIIDDCRRQIETRAPQTWTQRLSSTLFGRASPPDPLAFPRINPRWIPKSVPKTPHPSDKPADPQAMLERLAARQRARVRTPSPAPMPLRRTPRPSPEPEGLVARVRKTFRSEPPVRQPRLVLEREEEEEEEEPYGSDKEMEGNDFIYPRRR